MCFCVCLLSSTFVFIILPTFGGVSFASVGRPPRLLRHRLNEDDDRIAGSLRWKLRHRWPFSNTFICPKNIYYAIQRQKKEVKHFFSIFTVLPLFSLPVVACELLSSNVIVNFVTLYAKHSLRFYIDTFNEFLTNSDRTFTMKFLSAFWKADACRLLRLDGCFFLVRGEIWLEWKDSKLGHLDDIFDGWELESSWRSFSRERVERTISKRSCRRSTSTEAFRSYWSSFFYRNLECIRKNLSR